MPLNYASMEQVSGWRFLWHRMSVAVCRHSVRLVHDPSRNYSACLVVGTVITALGLGICLVISFLRPVGQIGDENIVADRGTGALYVKVDGRMHPALNLASARLIAGQPASPKMVPMSSIEAEPMGPQVGIVGAPDDLTVRTPADTGWGLCDRLGSVGSQIVPAVTVLAGLPDLGSWAHDVRSPQATLMTYGRDTFLVTDGHRSLIDLADKPVTLALGIQAGLVTPSPMSRAMYEALIPTAPLTVPDIPNPGGPVGYSTPQLPLTSGTVIRVATVDGTRAYFVALPAGVQMVPESVALMLTNADLARRGEPVEASQAEVTKLPQAVGFDVSMYPTGPVQLLDKQAEPVTCVMWRKNSGESRAEVTTVSGRRLPIPVGADSRVITLVSGSSDQTADEVYFGSGSANFVRVTGMEPDSPRAESLWWIGQAGVRFGIQTMGAADQRTREALGLKDATPVPAPWTVIRWLPTGPTLSHAAAMVQHDTLGADSTAAPLVTQTRPPGEGNR